MKPTTYSIVLLFLMMQCGEKKDNYETMLGEWVNVSMTLRQITVDSGRGPADSTLLIGEGQWDSILQMRPIRTTYSDNGTYVSRYYNLKDSLLFESEGNWYFLGDSLYLSNEVEVNAYFFEVLESNQARFVSQLDWDGDGDKDDRYDGIQQKQEK